MRENTIISLLSKVLRRIGAAYGAGLRCTIALGLVAAGHAAAAQQDGAEVCVLVPHFKDEYWLSVAHGLETEAEGLGIALRFHEAGGYRTLSRQIAQLDACVASGADAILLGAVSSDASALLEAIVRAGRAVPVLGLVNEVRGDGLSGAVGVDWRDMGAALGAYLAGLHPAGSPPVRAVLVTGPAESGWTGPLESGLRRRLADSSVDLIEVLGADTGLRQQLALVEDALARHPDLDYLIGSAPAVEAAMGLMATDARAARPELLATYVSHTVKRGLMQGQVQAVAFDDPAEQGRMALRQVARVLASGVAAPPTGPRIRLVTRDENGPETMTLSPSGYFPELR